MTRVVVLTDTDDYKLPPAVEASYTTTVNNAVAAGVQDAITNMGDVAQAVSDTLAPLTTTSALTTANVLPSAAKNAITGWFHADGYGAVGDGTTDDRAAIQAAMDAAGTAYTATGARQKVYLPPKIHAVGVVTYTRDGGSTYGIVSIMMRDGVELFGPGTLKVLPNSYGSGALYGVIRSRSGGLSHAAITQITIDGNSSNQTASTQCSNILIEAATDVEVSHTQQYNANGNAIMVRGTLTTYATNIRINRNFVGVATGIGIQSSQFDGLEIDGNTVQYTTDNAIDVYGEDGDTTAHGINFRVSNNRVRSCYTGVFCETVAQGIVVGNDITGCVDSGIHVNRINGQPSDILITGNRIAGTPVGAYFTGDTGTVTFRNNTVNGASIAAVRLGGGGGNCSRIRVIDNTLDTATANATPLVWANSSGGTVSNCRIRGNITLNTDRTYDYIVGAGTSTSGMSVSAANAA